MSVGRSLEFEMIFLESERWNFIDQLKYIIREHYLFLILLKNFENHKSFSSWGNNIINMQRLFSIEKKYSQIWTFDEEFHTNRETFVKFNSSISNNKFKCLNRKIC